MSCSQNTIPLEKYKYRMDFIIFLVAQYELRDTNNAVVNTINSCAVKLDVKMTFSLSTLLIYFRIQNRNLVKY